MIKHWSQRASNIKLIKFEEIFYNQPCQHDFWYYVGVFHIAILVNHHKW